MSEPDKWQRGYRTVITCLKCEDEIYSRYSGEFVACSCKTVFIDETPYYQRIGGDRQNFDWEVKQIEELDRTKENKDGKRAKPQAK